MKKTPRLFVGQVLKHTSLGGGQIGAVIVKVVQNGAWFIRVTTYKRKRLKAAAYAKTSLFSEYCSVDHIFVHFVPTGISLLENMP